MQLSARNVIRGKVKNVQYGAVNTEVTLTLPGGTELTSIITKASADKLGIAPGKEVFAVIKASSVMLGVD